MDLRNPATRPGSMSGHWTPLLIVAASVAVAMALIPLVMVHLGEPPVLDLATQPAQLLQARSSAAPMATATQLAQADQR